jgi:hypothetical protein
MNNHNNITSYFIKYNNEIQSDILIENDTIFIKGFESLIPGCLDKTIKSIEHIIKNNIEFDYIFRTNMSSVIDLNTLYDLLDYNYWLDLEWGGVIGYVNGDINKPFVSGAGMMFNKKTCYTLINNKTLLEYNVIDDVSISKLLLEQKKSMSPFTRFEAYNYEGNIDLITKDLISDYYHFRCKSGSNPANTIILMKKIIELLYEI